MAALDCMAGTLQRKFASYLKECEPDLATTKYHWAPIKTALQEIGVPLRRSNGTRYTFDLPAVVIAMSLQNLYDPDIFLSPLVA